MGHTWQDPTVDRNSLEPPRGGSLPVEDPLRDEVVDPLRSPTVTTASGGSPGAPGGNPLLDGLRGALGEPAAGDPTQELPGKLETWRGRIRAVTDPVAFMTSASRKEASEAVNTAGGSYDKAIADRNSAEGFYELARAECAAIGAEIQAFMSGGGLDPRQAGELGALASFLSAYAEMYASIQGSGGSSDASKRAALTDTVRSALMKAQALYASLPPDLLGAIAPNVEGAMGEIGMFVESWSAVASTSENTAASSQMWALFLQTIERYRQILNEYDGLEARGGDATGTAKMAIKEQDGSWAHTPEEGQRAAQDQGGYMAMALRSYGLHAQQAEALVKQVKEVVARVQAGEFASEAECVLAFRKHVGGGRASELFYKDLEQIARGHWKGYLASVESSLQQEANDAARQDQQNAKAHLDQTQGSIAERDKNAKTWQDNTARYGMTSGDYVQLGQDALDGKRKVVNEQYDPRTRDPADPLSVQPNATLDFGDTKHSYDEFGNLTTIYGQDTALVVGHGPSEEQLAKLGKATMSEQEVKYLDMDSEGTEDAYSHALACQKSAQLSARLAQKDLDAGEARLGASLQHYLKAQKHITEAQIHASHVKGDHPALVKGLESLESYLASIEAQLAKNEEIRKQLQASSAELEGILDKYTQDLSAYDPEKLKVPLPTATVDGVPLEVERFQKLTIDLAGPAWGVFWWMGGLEGAYSALSSTDPEADGWSKARIDIYAGLKADLWLFEAGVKLKGFFEAQKKDADGLEDVLTAGGEELGRWAYAWWYDLDSMANDIAAPIDRALAAGERAYDALLAASLDGGLVGSELKKAEEQMRGIHQTLAGQLLLAYWSKQGETEIDPAEGVKLADKVMPLDDVLAGIQALPNAGDQAPEQVKKEREGLRGAAEAAKGEAVAEIKKVDPGQNDPGVKFEAGVGIAGFAGFKLGEENKVSLEVSRVYSIQDGEGEDFDYSVHKKTKIKIKGDFKGGWGIEVGICPQEDGWDGELEVSIPVAADEDVDGSGVMKELRDALLGVKETDVQAWASRVEGLIKKDIPWDKYVTPKIGTGVDVKIGGELSLGDDLSIKQGAVKFGVVSKLEAGDKLAKVSYEQGNMVSLKFGG